MRTPIYSDAQLLRRIVPWDVALGIVVIAAIYAIVHG
jgi:hypothetical protein